MSIELKVEELRKQLSFVDMRLTFLQEEVIKINKEFDAVVNSHTL